jgi:hypothetical protein
MNTYKGLIFTGCSFTWGQGLYFYSGIEGLYYPQKNEPFSIGKLSEYQIKYMESKRFARIVANHFNTVEFVNERNGGTDKINSLYWSKKLGNIHNPFSDYSHLIFQLTQPQRSHTTFEINGEKYDLNPFDTNNSNYHLFMKWIELNNINFDEWYIKHTKETLNFVKEKLLYFESKGIQTYVLTWPDEYLEHIYVDEFLNEKLINFTYKNIIFDSLESLMLIPEMKISTDIKHLKRQVNDEHPSLSCHNIIAESIIKKISKK